MKVKRIITSVKAKKNKEVDMKLNEIKSIVALKGLTMSKLAILIGAERRTMYNRIKNNDEETLKKIEKVLKK